jgi:hypothetical protein
MTRCTRERRRHGQAQLDEEGLRGLAAHEAGHAVLALVALPRGAIRHVWLSPGDRGAVEWHDGALDELDKNARALIWAGGLAGQRLVGCGRNLHRDDVADPAFDEAAWELAALGAEKILCRYRDLFDRIRHELAVQHFLTGDEIDRMWIDDSVRKASDLADRGHSVARVEPYYTPPGRRWDGHVY